MIAATLRRVILSLSLSALLACGPENPLDAYRDYFTEAGKEPGAVTATFLGTATLLFDDGETALMTDGFFSRPAIELALDGSGDPLVEPDVATVEAWLERLGVTRSWSSTRAGALWCRAVRASSTTRSTT